MNVGPLHKVTLTQSDIIGMVVAQAQKKEVSVGCDVGIFWSGNTDLIQTIKQFNTKKKKKKKIDRKK